MNFWKSLRYQTFERTVDGDMLRGLPRNDFPWTLCETTCRDAQGDMWVCIVRCLGLEPAPQGGTVEARFSFEADCQLDDTTLRAFGFDPRRLALIGDGRLATVSESSALVRTVALDRIEKIAREGLDLFVRSAQKKWTPEHKRDVVRGRLAEPRLSPFALCAP